MVDIYEHPQNGNGAQTSEAATTSANHSQDLAQITAVCVRGPEDVHRQISPHAFEGANIGSAGIISQIPVKIEERHLHQQAIARLEQRVEELRAELELANQELESFSYSVSHDLRAPLRSIDGFSRMLSEDYGDKLGEDGKDSLARVRKASQRMDQLIDGLLELSRLTSSEMNRTTVNLSALARKVADRLQSGEPERRVEFEIEPDLTATADPSLMRVVLTNLLANAWKFTGEKKDPRIEFGRAASGEVSAYFVRDNGVGFDMAYSQRLFGAFQRMHAAAEFPGIGVGLTAARRIIQRHNGRVWAESHINKGAAFYFTLPDPSK